MSVKIVDGYGTSIKCEKCQHDLILNSTTDYNNCENCGYAYTMSNISGFDIWDFLYVLIIGLGFVAAGICIALMI